MSVVDDGTGAGAAAGAGGGHGLIGIRERVAVVGGEVAGRARPAAASRSGRRSPTPLEAS